MTAANPGSASQVSPWLASAAPRQRSALRSALRLLRRNKLGMASAIVLLILIALAVLAPVVTPYGPNRLQYGHALQSPGGSFLLGTDQTGRDIFSRLVWGARTSLLISLIAVAIGVTAGSFLGTVCAWYGGWLDIVVQRLVDGVQALPALMVAMVLTTVLKPSVWTIALAIGINFIPPASRIARSIVFSLREAQFVVAVRAAGASDARLLFRHVVPNLVTRIVVIASSSLAGAILVETSLSFLGLGIQPPSPTWGSMVAQEGQQFLQEAPWILFSACAAISLTVISATLFGDAVRDMLDPRVRSRR
jgi:ABC-type dipeptide/oligopeptide/nickel transport system permease subunit